MPSTLNSQPTSGLFLPELGRFLQPDPIQFKAGDYNLYRYCHNDPINKSDPLGLDFILLNDSEAAHDNGHNAALVGNDKDGWTYFSKNGGPDNVMKSFQNLKDFQKSSESERFDRALRIPTDQAQDKTMKEYGSKNYNKPYGVETENCADLTGGIGKSGNVNLETPKKGGIIYRNATAPNKQFNKLKDRYKDEATPVKPHLSKG